jgi:hypothetical protein
MCDNMNRLLLGEGVAVISVPHVWDVHAYPADYWRFTAEGAKRLFPGLEFPPEWSEASGLQAGDHLPLPEQPGLVWLTVAHQMARRRYLAALRAGLGKWLLGTRVLFAPTMLNMIGRRPRDCTGGPCG